MKHLPLLLKPAVKDYLWGGSRLNDEFNLNVPVSPFAEAWVCSTHPDGCSDVPDYDCSLPEVLAKYPEYLGSHVLQLTGGKPELPILIKLNYHHSHEHRDEVWTVISGYGDTIVDGMRQPVKVGDVITIEAGCKHTLIVRES